jgi:hypothetical protein
MSLHHSSRRLAVVAIVGLVGLSGCAKAAEKLAEKAAEEAIESESGENVDVDLGGDGGVSVESEDGSFSVNEDGEFVVEDNNGSVVASGESNGDGDLVIEGSNGESIVSGKGIPAGWPSDVPVPTFASPDNVLSVDSGDGTFLNVSGPVDGDAIDVLSAYTEQLEAAGWKKETSVDSGTSVFAMHTKGDHQISTTADTASGLTTFSVTYTTS